MRVHTMPIKRVVFAIETRNWHISALHSGDPSTRLFYVSDIGCACTPAVALNVIMQQLKCRAKRRWKIHIMTADLYIKQKAAETAGPMSWAEEEKQPKQADECIRRITQTKNHEGHLVSERRTT